jgi:hypothetical protein
VFKSVGRAITSGALLTMTAATMGFALAASPAAQAATGNSGKKPATATAATKKTNAAGKVSANRKPSSKPVNPPGKRLALTVLEGPDARGEISAITEDNEFAYLHLPPGARVRQGGKALTAAEVQEGMKLVCWGSWDRYDTDVFDAIAVSVRGRVDDYALRNKISDACRNVARRYAHTPVASAATATVTEAPVPAEVKPAAAPSATPTPAPATGSAPAVAPSPPPADAPAVTPSAG